MTIRWWRSLLCARGMNASGELGNNCNYVIFVQINLYSYIKYVVVHWDLCFHKYIFSLHKIAVIWISVSTKLLLVTELYLVNVYFWKCIQTKITGFRYIVLLTRIIFSGKMPIDLSLYKSLKFYELMWKIRMILVC